MSLLSSQPYVKLSACALLLVAFANAEADAFFCGQNTIRERMPSAEIEQKCGPPDLVEVFTEPPVFSRLHSGEDIQVGGGPYELWYYDRGPSRFVARITVRDGQSEEVKLLNIRDIRELESR